MRGKSRLCIRTGSVLSSWLCPWLARQLRASGVQCPMRFLRIPLRIALLDLTSAPSLWSACAILPLSYPCVLASSPLRFLAVDGFIYFFHYYLIYCTILHFLFDYVSRVTSIVLVAVKLNFMFTHFAGKLVQGSRTFHHLRSTSFDPDC